MINQKQYYYDNLGPAFHYYIQKLDEYISYFDNEETVFLFCSRAGLTIHALYDEFLKRKNLQGPTSAHILWTSRFILSKSFILSSNTYAQRIMLGEHRYTKPEEFVSAITPTLDFEAMDKEHFPNDTPSLLKLIEEKDEYIEPIISNLEEQANTYKAYLDSLIQGKKRVILIDSGWQGSIQDLLQEEYPELDVHGLYFGTIGTPHTDRKYHARKYGLVFSAETQGNFRSLKLDIPQKVFALHRHIIEDVLEPGFSSVEHIEKNIAGDYLPANYEEIQRLQNAPLKNSTQGILDYLTDQAEKISRAEIQALFFKACATLRNAICHPAMEDLEALGGLHRSFDFGKEGGLSVLLPATNRHDYDSAERRIQESLWSHGQIAIEYEDKDLAFKLQAELQKTAEEALAPTKKIAIITRTKNRPILLERAGRSVARQTYDNYLWVVVNDGGEEQPVLDVIKQSGVHPSKVILVSNPVSLGMEAASNRGISHSESDYIIIHDDDDSWESEFLYRTTSFLEGQQHAHYEGVITGTTYISEEVTTDGQVKIHRKTPYNDWVRTVHLTEMANGNFFAPIAFLFSRKIYDLLGGYDESLPVLGDWDFNLRFLTKSNIGVIPQALANYHHRDVNNNAGSNYSNSVIGGISKHQEYDPVVRNKYVRGNLPEYQALSHLLTTGYASNASRHISHQILEQTNTHKLQKQLFDANDIIVSILKIPGMRKYFDLDFYTESNPDLKEAKKQGTIPSFMDHFINYGCHENRPFRMKTHEIEKHAYVEQKFEEFIPYVVHLLELDPDFFDEEFYLKKNPDIAEALKKKEITSATQHFIESGFKEEREFRLRPYRDNKNYIRSKMAGLSALQSFKEPARTLVSAFPAIFDEEYYANANPDVQEALASQQLSSAIDHFLFSGLTESRPFRINCSPLEQKISQQDSTLTIQAAWLKKLVEAHHKIFDTQHYLANNNDIVEHLDINNPDAAFEHFVTSGIYEGRPFRLNIEQIKWALDSEPEKNWYIRYLVEKNRKVFDEEFYLESNQDIKEAITHKQFKNGVHHFVACGFNEPRPYKLKITGPGK